ncbi:unnamed protein product, partial [Prorocentrum cordatum]
TSTSSSPLIPSRSSSFSSSRELLDWLPAVWAKLCSLFVAVAESGGHSLWQLTAVVERLDFIFRKIRTRARSNSRSSAARPSSPCRGSWEAAKSSSIVIVDGFQLAGTRCARSSRSRAGRRLNSCGTWRRSASSECPRRLWWLARTRSSNLIRSLSGVF